MDTVEMVCKAHGLFTQRGDSHLSGTGCPSCLHRQSKPELELIALLMDKYPDIEIKSSITPEWFEGKREIDIYIPQKRFGIEYHGLYWHSEIYKPKNYHLLKTNECNKNGISLIHIFEDEWLYKKEIVVSILLNKIKQINTNIYGRKCEIREISSKISKDFLNKNHIQGNVNSKVKIGLYYEAVS